ncbi:AraC family transcriptional regulator [Planotetraspora mira]|uniref:AraC family transcriptional regulator n=1 Tax=Planotetraspora mira TaxID=58121 RepID=A0A8J3TUY9_9ACTN|nr:AraC family transcriptional regulator [Planotetraspora mira]GII32951.1 AraC family transcriptional regulator [Planotetraspora mira]
MDVLAELQELIARHSASGSRCKEFNGVELTVSSAPTEPLECMAGAAFAVIAQGAKRVVLNGSVFDYHAGQYLVVSVDLPLTAYITQASADEPFSAFALTLKPAAIATLLLETASQERAPSPPPGIAVSDAPFVLLDAVVRLLRLFDHPADARVLGPGAEREILWRLITGAQGAMIRQIGLADSRLSQIGRAIQWIRQNYDATLRIDEMAQLARMSVTSFHRHFRAVTTMTPIQYQKQIRLQEARFLLMERPRDVAGVGFAVGYDSPSQFSREYRRQFGLSPGQDATRRKNEAAPA